MIITGQILDNTGTPHKFEVNGGFVRVDGDEVKDWDQRRPILAAIGTLQRLLGDVAMSGATQPKFPYETEALAENKGMLLLPVAKVTQPPFVPQISLKELMKGKTNGATKN